MRSQQIRQVAIIGGGPGGLSAAYYLSLMGHKVTVFEQRKTAWRYVKIWYS